MAIDREKGISFLDELIEKINNLGANVETKRKIAQNSSRIKDITFQVSLEKMIKKGEGKVFFQINPEHSYIFTTDSIYLRDDTNVGIDNGKLVFDPQNAEFTTDFVAGLLERLSYGSAGNIGKIGFTRSYQKTENNTSQDQSSFDHLMALYLAEKVTGHKSSKLFGCQRAFLNCLEEVFGTEPIMNSFMLNGGVEPNLKNMFDDLLQTTNPSAYDFMTTKLSTPLPDPKDIQAMNELIQGTRDKLIIASVAKQAFESKKVIDNLKSRKQDVTAKVDELSQNLANWAEKYGDIPDFEQRVIEKIEQHKLENERKKKEFIEQFKAAGSENAHQFATRTPKSQSSHEPVPEEKGSKKDDNHNQNPEPTAPKKEDVEEKNFSPPPLSQEEKIRKIREVIYSAGVRAATNDLTQKDDFKSEEEPTVGSPLKENFIVNDITGDIIDQRNASFADRLKNVIVAKGDIDVVNDTLVEEKCKNSSQAYLDAMMKDANRVKELQSILGDDWMNEIQKAYEEGWKTGISMAVESIKEDCQKERNELASGKIGQEVQRPVTVSPDELVFAERHFGFVNDFDGNQIIINLENNKPVQSLRTQSIMNSIREMKMGTFQSEMSDSSYDDNKPKTI